MRQGMTKAGIERKATCRALFSKLLYLADSEDLAPSLDPIMRRKLVQARVDVSHRSIFACVPAQGRRSLCSAILARHGSARVCVLLIMVVLLPQDVFGATDSDVDQLRIVSLYDVDLDAMDALASGTDAPGTSDQPGSPTAGDD